VHIGGTVRYGIVVMVWMLVRVLMLMLML